MKVFISYRRSDTQSQAERLTEDLRRKFGAAAFLDIASIRGGENWQDRLRTELANASVVLVLMGEGWLSAVDEHHRRRISLPNDWIRREVAAALAGPATVIPVCVNGTRPLALEAVSDIEDIKGVASLNSMFLSEGRSWRHDVDDIAQRLVELGFEFAPDSPDAITAELLAARKEIYDLKERLQVNEAVTALQDERGKANENERARIDEALGHLRDGDTDSAEAVFDDITKRFEEGSADAAYRHKGALAFLHDTGKALSAYRRATELEPDNLDGWNQFGHLLRRTGALDEAIAAYTQVLDRATDETWQAIAYGNLGNIHKTRGDLDEAERLYRKSLHINEAMGRQEGMAIQYNNLGGVFALRKDARQAREYCERSLGIFEALGSPHAQTVRDALAELENDI